MIQRGHYIDKIESLLTKEKLILVTGARQVGKTTLLQMVYERYMIFPKIFINCEDRLERPFSSKNEMIQWFRTVHAIDITKPGLLIFDEIQHREKSETILKNIYDSKDIAITTIVTGSRFGGQVVAGSTLVGRGVSVHVSPCTFEEVLLYHKINSTDMSNLGYGWIQSLLHEYMLYGGYPAVVREPSLNQKRLILESIITNWQDKDMTYFFAKQYKPQFVKLLQHIALNIGNMYKEDPLCASLSIGKRLIKEMLQFLQESFVLHTVTPFFTDKTKEYNALSELYFADLGWINMLRGSRYSTDTHDGKLVENFVAQQISQLPGTLNYYKKRSGSEIDFVWHLDDGHIVPVEVKAGDKTIIPKSFAPMLEEYRDRISCFIVTTQSVTDMKMLGSTSVYFVPYWRVKKFVEQKLGEVIA